MKLNLGAGKKKIDGYVNVDNSLMFAPDEVVDLNNAWPWADNSVEEVVASHVLDHLPMSPTDVMLNLYRILKPGGKASITVPHPRSDDFINDPSHHHGYMPQTFEHFSKKINQIWQEKGYANTPLALMHDIDFAIEGMNMVVTPEWNARIGTDPVKVQESVRMFNNVISEFTVRLIKKSGVKESEPAA